MNKEVYTWYFPGSKTLWIITGTTDEVREAKGTEELTHLPTVTEISAI